MNIRLKRLTVRTRQLTENLNFAKNVTFLYGPVGTGKSTVARCIDYCFGGDLERTPAIQQELVAVILEAQLGEFDCVLERGAEDTQSVRVSWSSQDGKADSVNAKLAAGQTPIVGLDVYNLSDLLFFLCGVTPIKVPQRIRDPDSPMIRLSFRDIWCYCYLDQAHLDSSFFRLEDPFRGRKSQDAMRFFTSLHSEHLSQLQADLYQAQTDQQVARETVARIRLFMSQFDLGSEIEIGRRIEDTERLLDQAVLKKQALESERLTNIHPTDILREELRQLSKEVSDLMEAKDDTEGFLAEQDALRAELITAKVKAERADQAGRILEGVSYTRCPQCGTDIGARTVSLGNCGLCNSELGQEKEDSSLDLEVIRRELNDRIDQIADSINRRRLALQRTERDLRRSLKTKRELDQKLQDELSRYDSAYVESIRGVDQEVATLIERRYTLLQLHKMPLAINELEQQAGSAQGLIDQLRSKIEEERGRLKSGDANVLAIAKKFKAVMLRVGYPGVSEEDEVSLDPRNWKPIVTHKGHDWGFWDTGSGGKKTLFNVCFALALHEVAFERGFPLPNLLIIDSPTKNISDDENPELVKSLYREIFRIASSTSSSEMQFLLIDSDLVEPEAPLNEFFIRRMAGTEEAPSLISYYSGP